MPMTLTYANVAAPARTEGGGRQVPFKIVPKIMFFKVLLQLC